MGSLMHLCPGHASAHGVMQSLDFAAVGEICTFQRLSFSIYGMYCAHGIIMGDVIVFFRVVGVICNVDIIDTIFGSLLGLKRALERQAHFATAIVEIFDSPVNSSGGLKGCRWLEACMHICASDGQDLFTHLLQRH